MTQPIDYHSPGAPLPFTNRKGGLTVFGILMIVMGSLAGCLGIITPLALIMQMRYNYGKAAVGDLLAAVVIYIVASVTLVWGGIGCVKARRWIRPLVICVGVLALWAGMFALISMAILIPRMNDPLLTQPSAGAATLPAGAYTAGLIIGLVAAMVFYLVIPGIFVGFFWSDHVRQTLEHFDPQPRWTDRCPIPVLGVSIAMFLVMVMMLMAAVKGVLTVFGIVITGVSATLLLLLMACALWAGAVLVYRLRQTGWKLAVTYVVLFGVSNTISALVVDLNEVATIGRPPEQVQAIQAMGGVSIGWTITSGLLIPGMGLIYLIRIRKYFDTPAATVIANTQ